MEVYTWDSFHLMGFDLHFLQEILPFLCEGVGVDFLQWLFFLIESHEHWAEVPELMVGNMPLGLLIDFAPLFSDFGDELLCDGRTFYFFCFSIAIHDCANEDWHEEYIQDKVEGQKEETC